MVCWTHVHPNKVHQGMEAACPHPHHLADQVGLLQDSQAGHRKVALVVRYHHLLRQGKKGDQVVHLPHQMVVQTEDQGVHSHALKVVQMAVLVFFLPHLRWVQKDSVASHSQDWVLIQHGVQADDCQGLAARHLSTNPMAAPMAGHVTLEKAVSHLVLMLVWQMDYWPVLKSFHDSCS